MTISIEQLRELTSIQADDPLPMGYGCQYPNSVHSASATLSHARDRWRMDV